jgi:ATP-binding cassette subfamily B protein
LLREAQPYRLHIAGLFALSLLSSVFVLLTPLPLAIAVDSVVGSHPLPGFIAAFVPGSAEQSQTGVLLVAAGLFVLIPVLKQLQQFGNLVLSTYAGEKLLLDFRSRLFRHAERLSLAYHDSKGTADSTYRIQYDATAIQNIAIAGLIPFFTATVTVAGMIYVTARINWQLALVSLAIAPVLFLATRIYRKRLRAQWHDAKRLESSALSVVQESLEALRVVKAFGREDHSRDRFTERSAASVRAKIDLSFVEGRFGLLVGATIGLGMGTVLFIGTRQVLAGAMTLGALVLVVGYLEQLYEPLKTASKKVGTLQSSLASAERVYSLLDQSPDFVDPPHARPLARAAGAVAFRNVSFAYESRERVLDEVSFEVQPGSRLGIAGTTGAGKTTLVSLLTRFYDPNAGEILLDGVDLRQYRLADLRNQFAIVLQEPVLFSTSIGENIAYARPGACDADIVAAAKTAGAHDFILALPDGYDTPVGERGVRLSGGERQRISLARAFLKDAPILILDEPTSSVDARTEAQILEAMERLMRGRTAFMIAHRTSTLEICDLRLALEHGRVVGMSPGDGEGARAQRLSLVRATRRREAGVSLPPAEVVELARHLVAGPDDDARLLVHEPLKKSVHRLRFEWAAGPTSLVVKRLPPRVARANELVAHRWLPAVGLEWGCPGLRGVVLERSGSKVWHIYEDVPGNGLDETHPDPARFALIVELIVDLHTRFVGHALLPQCRTNGGELGMEFFAFHVSRSIDVLKSIGATSTPLRREAAELRDRLLSRVEHLYAERELQASLVENCGVPDTLLHGDLWLTNTLVALRPDGFQATLIDWDHVGVGPVTYDLSTFLYRVAPEHRPWILAQYREAAARRGWQLPDDTILNSLFETAECARYACNLGDAALAASRGESWGLPMMAEIDRWFARLEPALVANGTG